VQEAASDAATNPPTLSMQFSSLSLTKRIVLSICASFTIVGVSGLMINRELHTVIETQQAVNHTMEVGTQLNLLLGALVDIETGSRGFAVAGGEAFLEPYESGNARFGTVLATTRALVSDNPAQVERLDALARTKDEWTTGPVKAEIDGRRAVRAGSMTEASFGALFNEARGKALMDRMRAMIREMADVEERLMDEREKAYAAAIRSSRLWLGVGLTSAIALGAGLLVSVTVSASRKLIRISSGLDDGAAEVASAASQVSGSSQSLAEGSSEQAASLEETSASLEEMSGMTARNSENALTAKTLTDQTRAAAEAGATHMQTMAAAMDDIKASGDNIAKIIKTIDEIAFQTNILALNAAVEAARAGEAGMGFAVVAEEVRNLAQRSAAAARETAERIEDSIRKSENGVQISAKVASSLNEIVTKARQVDELVAQIANASKEQNQGIQQVNTAVSQMDKVTQGTAASAEETASAAEELNSQAGSMKDLVVELRAIVAGVSAVSRLHTPTVMPRSTVAAGASGRPRATKQPADMEFDLTGSGHRTGSRLPADMFAKGR